MIYSCLLCTSVSFCEDITLKYASLRLIFNTVQNRQDDCYCLVRLCLTEHRDLIVFYCHISDACFCSSYSSSKFTALFPTGKSLTFCLHSPPTRGQHVKRGINFFFLYLVKETKSSYRQQEKCNKNTATCISSILDFQHN